MCLCVVAVKVVLVPDGHVMTMAFAIGLSIQELKRLLASELRVPAEVLQISLDGTDGFCFSAHMVKLIDPSLIPVSEIKHTQCWGVCLIHCCNRGRFQTSGSQTCSCLC